MQPVFAPRTTPLRRSVTLAAVVALVGVPVAMFLAFAYAPMATISLAGGGTQDDLPQKIFYLHVPIAFAAYLGFFTGAWNALLYLWRRQPEHDLRSYVGVHVGIVFGTLVLVTGSLWAHAAWGAWWSWNDRQLLVFLILYLYYAAYFMLRFSIDEGPARERASAVFALVGVALVPLSFLAIRIASTLIHPVVIGSDGLRMTSPMKATFVVAIVAMLALAAWMMQLEATVKVRSLWARQRSGAPRPASTVTVRAAMPVGGSEGEAPDA